MNPSCFLGGPILIRKAKHGYHLLLGHGGVMAVARCAEMLGGFDYAMF